MRVRRRFEHDNAAKSRRFKPIAALVVLKDFDEAVGCAIQVKVVVMSRPGGAQYYGEDVVPRDQFSGEFSEESLVDASLAGGVPVVLYAN